MTDQPQRPEEAGQTQPLGQSQPADPLAAPPAGVQAQPQLTPRKTGPSLPTSTLAMLGVALLVVGGVIGALIGHHVASNDVQANGRGNFSNNRGAYGFPGGGQGPQQRDGQQGGPQGQQGQGQVGPAGRGLAAGTVTAVDGDTVTVKQANGQTLKVKLSDSTTYTVTQKGTKADVKVGQQVLVTGQAGSDGTVSANSVRTGEQFVFGGRGTSAQGSNDN